MKQTGLDRAGDREGFATACPTGVMRSWADGRGFTDADRMGIDDIGFMEALIKTVTDNYAVDPRRVFLTGFSNGGSMAVRLVLDRPQLFSGAAVVSPAIPESWEDEIKSGASMPMMFVGGTADRVIPYDGGPMPGGYTAMPLERAAGLWAERHGRGSGPTIETRPGPSPGTPVMVPSFDECNHGNGVRVVRIEGGGHAWPGPIEDESEDNVEKRISLDLSREILNFFCCYSRGSSSTISR